MCAVSNYVAPHDTTSVHGLATHLAVCGLISSLSFQSFAAALRAIIAKGNLYVAGTSRADKLGCDQHHHEPNSSTSKERHGHRWQEVSFQYTVSEHSQQKAPHGCKKPNKCSSTMPAVSGGLRTKCLFKLTALVSGIVLCFSNCLCHSKMSSGIVMPRPACLKTD